MDYEKKYKEALEKAKTINSGKYVDIPAEDTILECIFPELKESEDERIRKELIDAVQGLWDNDALPMPLSAKRKDAWLAWLEKQQSVGEIVARCKDSWYNEGKIAGMAEGLTDDEKYQQGWHDALEKQGEQKPVDYNEELKKRRENPLYFIDNYVKLEEKKSADKVEPKFKVGEWITNGEYAWKIIGVKSLNYTLQSQDGEIVDDAIFYVDEQFHSFTIEDAKDGDVLHSPEHNLLWMYKNKVEYHACINLSYAYYVSYNSNIVIPSDVRPATKEQRDFLLSKIKETGYEWEAEKTES